MDWFKDCSTVEQIKKLFRELAMLHHPDHGGDTATMQAINAAYQVALKRADGQKSTGSDGKEHTYYYNAETERAVMDALYQILRIKMDAHVYLIGTWIWIEGQTKPVKEQLKAAGCRWHSERVAWYWRVEPLKTWRSKGDLSELAAKYGVREFATRREGEEIAA